MGISTGLDSSPGVVDGDANSDGVDHYETNSLSRDHLSKVSQNQCIETKSTYIYAVTHAAI